MGSSNPVKPRRTHVRDAPYKAFVSIYHYPTFSCSDNSKLATSRSLQRPLYKFIVDEKNDVLDVYLLLSCVLSPFDCIRFHRYHSRPPPVNGLGQLYDDANLFSILASRLEGPLHHAINQLPNVVELVFCALPRILSPSLPSFRNRPYRLCYHCIRFSSTREEAIR